MYAVMINAHNALSDPTAWLQQRRKARTNPDLEDFSIQHLQLVSTGLLAEHRSGSSPWHQNLVRVGTDLGSQLGVDQLLQRLLQQPAEQLLGSVASKRCQQFGVVEASSCRVIVGSPVEPVA